MSYNAGIIATDLVGELAFTSIGQVARCQAWSPTKSYFALRCRRVPSRNRRPDLAFVSFDRWPIDRPMSSRDNAWDVVPDLAVEVTSPTRFRRRTASQGRGVFPGWRASGLGRLSYRCVASTFTKRGIESGS